MTLTASLIPVKKITSHVPRSNFSQEEIEQAARAILAAEGTINPILVRRISLQAFEVVQGDFEYYAAARAREIDLAKGEMIDAIVLQPENEQALMEQIQLFRKQSSVESSLSSSSSIEFESRLTNLEKFLDKQFQELHQKHLEEKRRLELFVKEIQNQLPKPLEPLEFFNTANVRELASRFKTIGLIGKTSEKIILAIEEERKKATFSSLSDVTKRVKGFGEKRLLALLDSQTS